jgi:hypothetical protein
LCKNNYYYALSIESAPAPPLTLPHQHTGIPNSGSSGFYFSCGDRVASYNPRALTVGIMVANRCPEHSVASATLASISALPPATMSGQVMPSFPHTLIKLGPFADQGCKIVFDKTLVTIFHPNGHPILKGWWDLDSPQFWPYPLTTPPPSPAHRPPLAPISVGPSAALSTFLPHPSQGFQATSTTGEDNLVVFLHEATQSMAMSAQASSTPYNPQTLNLPSISALVSFYHACFGFPVKQTCLDAIKAGNCDTFDGSHTPTWQDLSQHQQNNLRTSCPTGPEC